jgi:hypothetical protein
MRATCLAPQPLGLVTTTIPGEAFKFRSSTYALPFFHLLLPSTSAKIFHSALYSLVPLSYILPLMSETRFVPRGNNIYVSRCILFSVRREQMGRQNMLNCMLTVIP